MVYQSWGPVATSTSGDRPSCHPRFFTNLSLVGGLLLGACGLVLLQAPDAVALEEVGLSYAGFQFGTLAMNDLAAFSATGQPSTSLAALLRAIKLDPAQARELLTTEVNVDGQRLAAASETFIGESFFQLVGTTFNLPGVSEPSWTYLRDALVVAAADNQVSTLEVLQAFAAESIVIETDKVGQVIEQIQNDTSTVKDFFEVGLAGNAAQDAVQ